MVIDELGEVDALLVTTVPVQKGKYVCIIKKEWASSEYLNCRPKLVCDMMMNKVHCN
jgi:hypothetical protein